METPYIEKDCIFEFEGKKFESGGAYISDNYVIGYMNRDMTEISTWHGELITNTVKITSSWKLPLNAWISDRMYQVKAFINNKWYTGRTCGGNMIVRLRPVKSKR